MGQQFLTISKWFTIGQLKKNPAKIFFKIYKFVEIETLKTIEFCVQIKMKILKSSNSY